VLDVYIDADGCAVKNETYRVAERYELRVFVVANVSLRVPPSSRIQAVVVGGEPDAADDWIAERVAPGDIVITADLPLAKRCLDRGARTLGPKGKAHTPDSIVEALATRELMEELRAFGEATGGPRPMGKKDRSRFLQKLDEVVHAIRREHGAGGAG